MAAPSYRPIPAGLNAMDGLDHCVFILDDRGNVLFLNSEARGMCGVSIEKARGRSINDFLSCEEVPSPMAEMLDSVSREGFWEKEGSWVTSGQGRFFVRCSANTLAIPGYDAYRILVSVRDIELVAKETEGRYRMLVERQGEGIGIVDEQERFLFVNPAGEVLFGLPEGGLVGRSLKDFVDEDNWGCLLKETENRRLNETTSYDLEIIRADAEKRFIHVTATPHFDKKNRFVATLGIFRDITKSKLLELELRRARDELEMRVAGRTADLARMNVELIRENKERVKVEKALRESEKKLSESNFLMERKNIALKEVLERVKEEKERLEDKISSNINRLINPLLIRFKDKGSLLDRRIVELIQENLDNITSSFGQSVSDKSHGLTFRETEICNMIAKGMTSKEISELLNVSVRTVENHRFNIRRKLKIRNTDNSLGSFLNKMKKS